WELSHERNNVAEAETLGTVEGNMCGIAMRDAVQMTDGAFNGVVFWAESRHRVAQEFIAALKQSAWRRYRAARSRCAVIQSPSVRPNNRPRPRAERRTCLKLAAEEVERGKRTR